MPNTDFIENSRHLFVEAMEKETKSFRKSFSEKLMKTSESVNLSPKEREGHSKEEARELLEVKRHRFRLHKLIRWTEQECEKRLTPLGWHCGLTQYDSRQTAREIFIKLTAGEYDSARGVPFDVFIKQRVPLRIRTEQKKLYDQNPTIRHEVLHEQRNLKQNLYNKLDKSVETLKKEGVPEDILKELERLKRETFADEEDYAKAVKTLAEGDLSPRQKILILKHAGLKRKLMLEDISAEFPEYTDEDILICLSEPDQIQYIGQRLRQELQREPEQHDIQKRLREIQEREGRKLWTRDLAAHKVKKVEDYEQLDVPVELTNSLFEELSELLRKFLPECLRSLPATTKGRYLFTKHELKKFEVPVLLEKFEHRIGKKKPNYYHNKIQKPVKECLRRIYQLSNSTSK